MGGREEDGAGASAAVAGDVRAPDAGPAPSAPSAPSPADTPRLEPLHFTLLDHLPVIVFRHGIERARLIFVNRAWERVLGRPVEEAYAQGLDPALADDRSREALRDALARAGAGEEVPWHDLVFVRRDGSRVTVRVMVYPVRDASGRVEAVEGIGRDVQAEVDARHKLVQTDRLAAIGQLAAGVAHEINNPAAFVALNLQHLARTFPQVRDGVADAATVARFAQTLEETAAGVRRIVATVDELKLFARIPEGAYSTPVDVNRLIRSALALTRSEIRGRARLVTELDEQLPLLPADPALLGQVCVNLLLHAAQSLPRGDAERNEVRVETRAGGDHVQIRVSDTGAGIAPETLPRLFDPFFSTPSVGGTGSGGTGLGLAISADAVRRMGGTLEVDGGAHGGTRFTVTLPVIDVAQAETRPPSAATIERVVIVEDEPALAEAMARQLEGRFEVAIARDAAGALRALEARDFDRILCDVGLPDTPGTTLFDRVIDHRPDLATRFVFVTGDPLDPMLEALTAAHGVRVLEKPFDPSELEDVLRGSARDA